MSRHISDQDGFGEPLAPGQDLDAANREKVDLALASTAHDLNQMLAVISGRLGLLQAKVDDSMVQGHLEAMATACRDASDLVGRLIGCEQAPGAGHCDPATVAHQVVAMILPPEADPQLPVCQVEVAAGNAVAVPGQVLREVLVNLLVNAREAMIGPGTIRLSGFLQLGRYQLRVTDDGPGIAPNLAPNIFDRGKSTKKGPRRGLGLAGCRLLLSRHGGGLELLDTPEQGAVFALDLPLADGVSVPENPGVEASSNQGLTGKKAGELQVLVVDDEPSMREMLEEVLSELGCGVTVVPDAEAALAIFQSGRYQVALLDQSLPGMSGVDLAGHLRKDDPCLAIFLMTGWGNPDAMLAPDRATIDFTARKPMEFKDLQRLLGEAVRLQAERQASFKNEF